MFQSLFTYALPQSRKKIKQTKLNIYIYTRSNINLIMSILIPSFKNPHYHISFSFTVPVTKVSSVSGMLTNLPCNITPSQPDDKVNLVLWYKDREGKPLFR